MPKWYPSKAAFYIFGIVLLSLCNLYVAFRIDLLLNVEERAYPKDLPREITALCVRFEVVLIALALGALLAGGLAYGFKKSLLGPIYFLTLTQLALTWYAWLAPLFVKHG